MFCMHILQILAKKMTVLYKLAREQLSKQYHYDFGLRALKSVLVMAGELKRGAPDLQEVETDTTSDRRESKTLSTKLKLMNMKLDPLKNNASDCK